MSTVTYEWRLEHLDGVYNKAGQLMCRVTEIEHDGGRQEPEIFMIPSIVADAFVRARREVVRRRMWGQGGVKLLIN